MQESKISNGVKDLRELEGRLIKMAALIGAVIIIALLLLRRYHIAIGLLTGTLVSIVNFKLLSKDVIKKASQNNRKIFLGIAEGYFLRYGLMAIVLIIAARKGIYYFLGAALGLFAIRLAIFIDTFLISKWKPASS